MNAFDVQNRAQFSPDQPSSSTVSITVLSVTPARAEKLFAFASIEIDIDGVQIGIHGIRAMHAGPEAAAIELPKYRDGDGLWRTAITLPHVPPFLTFGPRNRALSGPGSRGQASAWKR